tara:strand:- start:116 stop:682 length:567 start_codon:yes stop_codon:yes gene_type:complete
MKILIACEFSGLVRDEFIKQGHNAWSCDLLPSESKGQHFTRNIFEIINNGWDMLIAFPPCTHLAVSGARWFKEKIADGRQQQGIEFFMRFTKTNIPKVSIENPVSIMSRVWRKPDQIIQPYQFGDPFSKKTCLWLKGLPKLQHTKVVEPNIVTYKDGSKFSADYGWSTNKRRSVTYPGIAKAMATQWG